MLVVGLDPHRVPGPWDPAPVTAAVARGLAGLADAGLDAESCLVGIDGSEDPVVSVAAALRRRPWDCVVIGGGIRGSDDLLELFETAVNLARRLAPTAEIAFSQAPDDLLGAVTRRLGAPHHDRPAATCYLPPSPGG